MHLYEQSSLLKNRLLCVFFFVTHVNRKIIDLCIYEERFRPKLLSYRAFCCPFFFWYQHSRRQMSTLKGALWRISRKNLMIILGIGILLRYNASLRASPPIWVSEASLARTRERAAKLATITRTIQLSCDLIFHPLFLTCYLSVFAA